MAARGELLPTDLIWKAGLPEWMPASNSTLEFPERPEHSAVGQGDEGIGDFHDEIVQDMSSAKDSAALAEDELDLFDDSAEQVALGGPSESKPVVHQTAAPGDSGIAFSDPLEEESGIDLISSFEEELDWDLESSTPSEALPQSLEQENEEDILDLFGDSEDLNNKGSAHEP